MSQEVIESEPITITVEKLVPPPPNGPPQREGTLLLVVFFEGRDVTDEAEVTITRLP